MQEKIEGLEVELEIQHLESQKHVNSGDKSTVTMLRKQLQARDDELIEVTQQIRQLQEDRLQDEQY
jgi:hypothetical protein